MVDDANHTLDARRAAKEQGKALDMFLAPLMPMLAMQVAFLRLWAGGFEAMAKTIETKID